MSTDRGVAARFAEIPTVPPPVVRPKVTGATIKPRTLHPARRASKRLGRKARKATRATVRISVSKAARIELRVLQGRAGRQQASTCAPVTKKNRKRRACTRFVELRGTRTFLPATTVRTTLTPTWRGRALPAGAYRLSVVAVDADGTRIPALTRSFRVAR